jgi:hypothetical protein
MIIQIRKKRRIGFNEVKIGTRFTFCGDNFIKSKERNKAFNLNKSEMHEFFANPEVEAEFSKGDVLFYAEVTITSLCSTCKQFTCDHRSSRERIPKLLFHPVVVVNPPNNGDHEYDVLFLNTHLQPTQVYPDNFFYDPSDLVLLKPKDHINLDTLRTLNVWNPKE